MARAQGKGGGGAKPGGGTPQSARAVAIRVLLRVAERGAYASRALDAELGRARLSERDAALATEIVYGALRVLPELDGAFAPHLRREPAALDGLLRAALRAATYQLLHLSRVPAHAVVDETVRAVRAARGPGLAGVANAVLRKVAEAGAKGASPGGRIAVPSWVEAELTRALGAERRDALLAAGRLPPPLALRLRAGVAAAELAAELRAARPQAEWTQGRVSPLALLLRRAGDPRALPGYEQGRFAVQEEGAQAVALCLGAEPGEAVADLCAGHGGKSALLAERVGVRGELLAVDVDERKLQRIGPELARLGLCDVPVQTRAIDLTVGVGGVAPRFDRVLVDAPCTGLGTLRRRPELLLRLSQSDPERLAAVQLAILERAVRLVRPGGVLLYAVCSPTASEGPEVAARFESMTPGLRREWSDSGLAIAVEPDRDGVVRLGPWLGGVDADSPDVYQLVRWRITAG
jgi:16S rRNA (cytosine967-C5)-methyltransferase